MRNRHFNSIIHFYNEAWAGRALNMFINPSTGPDLVDESKIVEVKFALIHPGRYTHVSWRALGYQMNYPKNWQKKGYWALGTYVLSKEVKDITIEDGLESLVRQREL